MFRKQSLLSILIPIFAAWVIGGCVYYNTFYNAHSAFNNAEKQRKKSGQVNQADYKKAIDKSLKVVEYHANSKWYDDALYVLGVSYYWTKQYTRAERRFRELLANYPNSKFIKESNLYLAKSKLELEEMGEAMTLFDELFRSDYSREIKAEAAMALGVYHYEDKDYETAQGYFQAVRDSLGNQEQKKIAQKYIADGQYIQFRFQDAVGAYLQLLGMDPTKAEKYHALHRAALCSYRLQRIKTGLDYLNQLIKDPLYFDSLGVLQLDVAEGYEADGDLALAEGTYSTVATTATNNQWASKAYYRLGLLYQYDYDDLESAKRFYDKAVGANAATEEGREALQRSSDISKLDTFLVRITPDSNVSQEQIDSRARTQYLLAELYWFQLNKPDSAISELEQLLSTYPHAYIAPKAMIALSQMYRDYAEDTIRADSLVRAVIQHYPRSDYIPVALEFLGLQGSAADTGYAEWYLRRAEDFLIDHDNYDSARANYQMVVDSFPESKYHLQARFSLVWIKENYRAPGDSSLLVAYREIADSFAATSWGAEASKRLPREKAGQKRQDLVRQQDTLLDTLQPGPDTGFAAAPPDTGSGYIDPLQAVYRGPNGEPLIIIDVKPRETLVEFEYPPSAYNLSQNEFYLYFQIKLDFSGKVVDYVLKVPSGSDELDNRAGETISSMIFNLDDVQRQVSQKTVDEDISKRDPTGSWYVYKYLVKKPDYAR
ncbi:MAG: tetratricopeptide repeat protein [Candidatus Zixiibacteriota bacterium]